ncbi:MAG: YbaB/EbfC family nucleoid-associated protein [Patescibacteria group bacterium]|nr:YbaB/EbfC family nucleoid-associated protein [Patescibacteria group bacterium]
MFEKLKKINEIRALQKKLEEEKVEVEKSGVKISINGKMHIEKVELNPEINIEEQENIIKECFNEAMKKVQVIVAKKMSQTSGFGF